MHLKITYGSINLINHSESQVNSELKIPAQMTEFRDALHQIANQYFGAFTDDYASNYPAVNNKKDNYSCAKNNNIFIGITETIKIASPSKLCTIVSDYLYGGSEAEEEKITYKLEILLKILHPELYCDTTKYNFKGELNKIINFQKDKDKASKIKTNFNPHIYPVLTN